MAIQQHQQTVAQASRLILVDHRQMPTLSIEFTEPISKSVPFRQANVVVYPMAARLSLKDFRQEITLVGREIATQAMMQRSKALEMVEGEGDFTLDSDRDRGIRDGTWLSPRLNDLTSSIF